jgi:hypothetical protein
MARPERIQTIDGMIREAGWFKGTQQSWRDLTEQEREDRSFQATGCEVAYPTWKAPVDCLHISCQIRRGEKAPIMLTNRILRSELESGYLRFGKESTEGRIRLGRICRAIRRAAITTGIYDPWKLPGGWQTLVVAAIT